MGNLHHLPTRGGGEAARREMSACANQGDGAPAHQSLERPVDGPGPDLRTLQVAEQRDRPAGIIRGLSHRLRRRAMRLGVAVREVETRDVHARLDHRSHDLRRGARRSDRAHDARAAKHVHWYRLTRRVISWSASLTRRSSSSALITAPPMPRTRSP